MSGLREAVFHMSISPGSLRIVLPYVTVALAGMVTVFHHTVLNKRYGDARGSWFVVRRWQLVVGGEGLKATGIVDRIEYTVR